MKSIPLITKSLAILLIICSNVFGQYSWPESETYRQRTIEKRSGILRSDLTGTFKKISDDRYLIIKSGEGSYSKFREVSWDLESLTELKGNLLCPLYTTFIIKNKDNRKSVTWKNEYDYEKEIVRIAQRDASNKIIKEFTFLLKSRTTDHATLIYFLRSFIDDLTQGETIRFNFISSEPGLYNLKAQFVKEESLSVGTQEIETIKVKITPDMGAFNIILDRFVPPTLLWYSKKEPYVWLKYEGLESGRGSAHIITTVEKIAPLQQRD